MRLSRYVHRCRLMLAMMAMIGSALPLTDLRAADASPRSMTQQEAQDFAQILPKLQAGKPYVLNMADPVQKRLALRGLILAGRTPANAPQTHAGLTSATPKTMSVATTSAEPQLLTASSPGALQPIADIINFSEAPGNTGGTYYTATGYSSVPGGTSQSTILIELVDTQSQGIYSQNTQTQYAQGTNFEVSTTAPVVQGSTLQAVATITTTVNNVTQSVIVQTGAQVPATTVTMTQPNYCNGYPNCTGGNQTTSTVGKTSPSIRVCFNRGSPTSCDYYNSSGRPSGTVFFPVAGSVSFSNATINSNFAGGTYSIRLADPINGGGCTFVDDEAITGPVFTLNNTSANNVLSWTMPKASLVDPNGCLKQTAGRVMSFSFTANVPLTTPPGRTGFVSFDSTYNSSSPPGFFMVPSIYLEDSCVAAGTMVRLGDGTEAKVETLSADDAPLIKTAHGHSRQLLGTSKGVETHPMVYLKTNKGQELLLTRTHPVLTTSGLVMARDLKKGDRVKTEKGTASLTVVDPNKSYGGLVHSLRLGELDEPKGPNRTHTANGIFIGDSVTQLQLEQEEHARLQSDADHVARRLPSEAWRTEYRRFLAEQQ